MYISVPGHEDQSTGAGRQTSPDDETDATCLLAGQHSVSHSAGHGDDRAPAYSSDRLHPEQTTIHHCRLVRSFLSTRYPVSVFVIYTVVSSLCRLCSAGGACHDKAGRATCLRPASAFQGGSAARLQNLPHQAAAIEFSLSFCAVEKRSGGE
jgi:hypothetical protein